ncbi:MAG TPA: hypothetical protein VN756_03165 [Solirubrobacterales bacterium]|nr:hypothetical protein [Solirubrobacterales bacterium]
MTTRKITAGEALRLGWQTPGQADYLAQPSCKGTKGRHYCATHPDADVHNNLAFDFHLEESGKHVEVWLCDDHGPEVP